MFRLISPYGTVPDDIGFAFPLTSFWDSRSMESRKRSSLRLNSTEYSWANNTASAEERID